MSPGKLDAGEMFSFARSGVARLLLAAGTRFALGLCPAFLDDLLGAAQGERFGGDILSDAGAGGDICPGADCHRRHQRGIASNEDPISDVGGVLMETVVVAGDGARADVHVIAYLSIAQVAKVV